MRALILAGLALAAPVSAHRIPDVFTTGQRLIDQFDPDITPKVLYSPEGTFEGQVPSGGWENNAELYRHVRSIDAENGRWYIRATYDGGRGTQFCFPEKERPNDETFYPQVIFQLKALPRARLQRDSATARPLCS